MLRRIALCGLLTFGQAASAQSPPVLPSPVAPSEPVIGHTTVYPPGVVDVTPEITGPPAAPIVPAGDACYPFVVSAEYLLLRPYRRNLDYGLVDARNDFIPQGVPADLEWQTDSGFRLGFSWRPRGGATDLSFTYTYAYSRDDATAAAPPGGLIYPTLMRPGTIDAASTAEAFSSVTFHVFDVDFGRRVQFEDLNARFWVGSRSASISQVIGASYDGFDARQSSSRQRLQMDAGGLTLGGESRWRLGRNWSAYGRARGSILVADYCLQVNESNFAGNVPVTDFHDTFTKVVPVVDLGAGLTWSRRNFHLSVGYEISHWFNQVETLTFLDDFAEGRTARTVSDLSLEAVTFRFGFDF
jgi:hypothetical protein